MRSFLHFLRLALAFAGAIVERIILILFAAARFHRRWRR